MRGSFARSQVLIRSQLATHLLRHLQMTTNDEWHAGASSLDAMERAAGMVSGGVETKAGANESNADDMIDEVLMVLQMMAGGEVVSHVPDGTRHALLVAGRVPSTVRCWAPRTVRCWACHKHCAPSVMCWLCVVWRALGKVW